MHDNYFDQPDPWLMETSDAQLRRFSEKNFCQVDNALDERHRNSGSDYQ